MKIKLPIRICKMPARQVFDYLRAMSIILLIIFCAQTLGVLLLFFGSPFFDFNIMEGPLSNAKLLQLYSYNKGSYFVIICFHLIISVLMVYLMHWVAKIFAYVNFIHPFGERTISQILKSSKIAFQIGIIALLRDVYVLCLIPKEVYAINDRIGNTFWFLFLGAILYGIFILFKRGLEFQSENDLTV